MRMMVFGLLFSAVTLAPASAQTASCTVDRQGTFPGDREVVRLSRKSGLPSSGNFAVYRAALAVNTDGAPTSYHPEDPLGTSKAINRYDNGVAVRRSDGRPTTHDERLETFQKWRDANWTVPNGYRISWKNVIAATPANKPCVFSRGEAKGYFGSLTALRNGLSGANAGECMVNDQLDQRSIPAIVLRGPGNPLTTFGAKTGDLVVAINPANQAIVPAVIGDTGNGNRIGEGSVALNMALLKKVEQPKTYEDAKRLDTGNKDMTIAVLPRSITFQLERPYTSANIESRVRAWAAEKGYGSLDNLASVILDCASGL